MTAMKKLDAQTGGEFFDLTGSWPTYGGGQKSHFHPQITPDRKWILFTGGDPRTQTNHLFLLDATDLEEMAVISPELLSPTGENDITSARLPKDLIAHAIPWHGDLRQKTPVSTRGRELRTS